MPRSPLLRPCTRSPGRWDDWNALAIASVAGHIIECGAQATGGYYRHWEDLDLANVGYPIAELNQATADARSPSLPALAER